MPDKPKNPEDLPSSKDKKLSAEDLDKTVLDIDIRKLEAQEKAASSTEKKPERPADKTKSPVKRASPEDFEKTQLDVDVRAMKHVTEETLIFKRPPLDEEDTDLHGKKQKIEEESELTPALPEEAVEVKEKDLQPEPEQESREPLPAVEQKSREQKKSRGFKGEKAKALWKELTSFSRIEPPPQSKTQKILELIGGAFLLLLLLDASIEALSVASPLSTITVMASIFCVLVNVVFILKRGNFHVGVEVSAWVFMALLLYSTWKFGSNDTGTLTILRQPAADLFNIIFLVVLLFVLGVIFFQTQISFSLKILLSILVTYGALGFIENLVRGFTHPRIWNLEDTFLGTNWWTWIPWYYLRPTLFTFWILFPFLILYFLVLKTSSVVKRQVSAFRQNTFILILLILAFVLSGVILTQNRIPGPLSLFKPESLGVGQTRAMNYGVSEGESYDIEVTTANASIERTNDLALQYHMGALFSVLKDGKKSISLVVRGEGGREIPFLKTNDFNVLQESVSQKPIRVQFREAPLLRARTLGVVIDRSAPMAAGISYIEKALYDLFRLLNSREGLWLASFSDDVKFGWMRNQETLEKTLKGIFAQGGRNVSQALDKTLKTLSEASGDKAIFLLTTTDAVPEDLAKFSSSLKSSKIKLYAIRWGETFSNDSLDLLAEASGGKALQIHKGQNFSLALLGGFADAFPEYQISYEGQSFTPKLVISSPENGSEVYKETPLIFKILNWQDVRVKSVRFYIDGKLVQELPAQPEISFTIVPTQLSRGSHLFKVAALLEGGKEYSEEARLQISQELDFRFIRPLEGDVVGGQVNLEAYYKARSAAPVVRVDFLVDGQKIGEASSEPYLYTWDAQSQSGAHTLQAVANFADGSTKSDQIKVNVAQGFAVKLVSPSVGEFLSNLTEIEADVTHSLSEVVSKVEFFVDGELLGEVTQAPYKYLWDNTAVASGRHVLQARAYSSSHWATTDAVVVNIGSGGLAVALADQPSSPLSPDYIEWILDASASMNGQWGGQRKIHLAREAMIQMLPKIPSTTQVTYRVFGSQSTASHLDCKDSLLLYPLKAVDSNKVVSALSQVEARGMASLGYTLSKVRSDLKTAYGSRVVILLTDSFENCGGDPVGQLERWKKEKLNAKLYVVGLDLEGTRAETELKRLASITGGQYFSVNNEKELMAALDEMVKVTYRVLDYKNREIVQKPIGSPPVSLRTGEYRVDVDLEPPLVKDKVLINNGVEKKLVLKKEGNSFLLGE